VATTYFLEPVEQAVATARGDDLATRLVLLLPYVEHETTAGRLPLGAGLGGARRGGRAARASFGDALRDLGVPDHVRQFLTRWSSHEFDVIGDG
jgi:hypothetical protein